MRLTIVGPNLPEGAHAEFHVHAASCMDLNRGKIEKSAAHFPSFDFSSRTEVSDFVYSPTEFDCMSGEHVDQFWFAPCCSNLPQ